VYRINVRNTQNFEDSVTFQYLAFPLSQGRRNRRHYLVWTSILRGISTRYRSFVGVY